MEKEVKIKVLYLVTKSNWGGAQTYVFDLATHLPQDLEPVVAVGGDGLLVQKLREKNIRIIALPEAQRDIAIFKEIKLLYRLFKIIWQEKPSVMHVNSSKLAGLGAFVGFITRTRTIFTAHGWPFNEDRNKLAKAAMYFFSWLTSVFATVTITITQKDFVQGQRMWFVGNKMRMIHNGIGPIKFHHPRETLHKDGVTTTARDMAIFFQRSVLGKVSARDVVRIGTIAELTGNKGIGYLVEAAQQLPDANFFVFGTGELETELRSKINDLEIKNFTLAGFVPEASRFLKGVDIFVLPSLKEGLPYTLLEAGQAGLPVVASNIGGIPDIIGDAGLLVPPKNPELLARSLSALIKDEKLRQTLGQQLQTRVAKEFNFENFLSQTYGLYVRPKDLLIAKLMEDHELFRNTISLLTEEEATKDTITSEWTTKDILAHLAGWNWEYIQEIDRVLENAPTWQRLYNEEGTDNFNKKAVEDRQALSVKQGLEEWENSFTKLLARLEKISSDEWNHKCPNVWQDKNLYGKAVSIPTLFEYTYREKSHEGGHALQIREYFSQKSKLPAVG